MNDPIHHGPTVGAQALRALARYPERIAFVEGDKRTSYAAALDLVARMQAVYATQGFGRGDRIAILTANRSESWCASVAAQASAMSITWLHPLGSLDDQVDQMVEMYKRQDLQGLAKMISSEDSGFAEYEELLLVNRNKNWIPLMGAMMLEKPTFFAVGAGHLPGEYGVIELLRREGYTLRPLKS